MSKFCMTCGAKLEDGVKFCNECGAKVAAEPQTEPKKLFCSSCGQENKPGTSFCSNCGAKLISSAEPAQQAQPVQQQVPAQQAQPVQQQAPVQQAQPVQQQVPAQQVQPVQQQAPMQPYPNQMQQIMQKPKKNKTVGILVGVIVALVAVIAVGAVFIIKNLGGSKADDNYNTFCELTSHEIDSYMYARLLTEQILQSDTMTADPDEMRAMIEEAMSAWDAIGEISNKVQDLAEELADSGDILHISQQQNSFNLGLTAYAADEEDIIEATQTAEESLESATQLSEQLGADASAAYRQLSALQDVYDGRSTSFSEWDESIDAVAESFTTDFYISGEIDSSDTTTGNTQCVRTLSREVSDGALAISNVSALVNVGEDSSTIIMGSSDGGVVMDISELEDSLDSHGTVISVCRETPSASCSPVTFHSASLSNWFILDHVGGFTLSVPDKGNGIASPEIDLRDERIDSDRPFIDDYDDIIVIIIVNPGHGSIDEWLRQLRNGSEDIRHRTGEIIGEEPEDPEDPPEEIEPTERILNGQLRDNNAGSGDITISLCWGTHDDIDLHTIAPDGSHIYYSNKVAGGGQLDIDMNANSSNLVDSPIENIYFAAPESGHYKVYIKNYRDRTSGLASSYLVRVTIDGESEIYEGTIDSTGTEIVICEFDYEARSHGDDDDNGDVNEDILRDTLINRGAGDGTIRASMLWDTHDDLDLHMITPDGSHIYYGNKNTGGGVLDVDANNGSGCVDNPVENIFFAAPQSGHYKVYIHDYNDRTPNSTTHYLVSVKVGDDTYTFEGTMDRTGTEETIFEFDYEASRSDNVPDNAVYYDGSYYAYFSNNMTWVQANNYCNSIGGHLATITSSGEQSFIESNFSGCDGFIGGYMGSVDNWLWVTGEDMSYTNWNSGEPNDGNNAWVMQLWNGAGWSDTFNNSEYAHGFICEWDGMEGVTVEGLDSSLSNIGAISGDITISLAWATDDDLDLHVFTPNGREIYYSNKEADGGQLDVDMIPYSHDYPTPYVENIYFEEPYNGEYYVYVYNYSDHTDGETNYLVRVTIGDDVQTFEGTINGSGAQIEILGFQYGDANVDITPD